MMLRIRQVFVAAAAEEVGILPEEVVGIHPAEVVGNLPEEVVGIHPAAVVGNLPEEVVEEAVHPRTSYQLTEVDYPERKAGYTPRMYD